MPLKKSWLGLSALALALAALLPWNVWDVGTAHAENKGGDWKQISVLYASDTKGKIEPCG